jgi:hypothetical protein
LTFCLPGPIKACQKISLWEVAREKLYSAWLDETFLKEEAADATLEGNTEEEGIIDAQLSWEPHLKIFGRKVIGIKYLRRHYLERDEALPEPEKPTTETEIEQKLQVKVRGGVGERIFANVDYDDTAPRSEQQKMSLVYQGKKDEIIQEIALGDLRLGWPDTEFLAYNKSLFGARVTAKTGKFDLMGIGSVSEGTSESKTFTGKTTFEKKEIPDISYLKRRYYLTYFDPAHLPLTSQSLEVYLDDQDGTNNETSLKLTVTGEEGATYTGYFDLQYPGEDYLWDFKEGIIKFYRGIEENFVIAISYQDKDRIRHPTSGYRMIKKKQDLVYIETYELRNYYYLGSQKIRREDFTLLILDLNGQDVTSDYEFEIDYDFGVLKFTHPLPPFPHAYPPDSTHVYTIYTEYQHSVDVYLLHPDIVPESEVVWMDGRRLTKEVDYLIDYSSGFLTFLDPARITEETEIRVDYEWIPLMGGKATIMGVRGAWVPHEIVSLGSTFLSQSSPRVNQPPQVGSSPVSHQAMGLDTQFNFGPGSSSEDDPPHPFNLQVSGEVARSVYNPNTFGKAIIENFESTKISDDLSMDEDAWRLGSRPALASLGERVGVDILNEDISGEDINSDWSQDEIEVLVLSFDFSPSESWESLVYSISKVGRDYSERSSLELWIKGDGQGERLWFDLGVVSEDVDGDGRLDTEDKNGDGKLNPGEDIGIDLGGERIGSGNGKLDTEDLDGDGSLSTNENYSQYGDTIEPDLKISWEGWRKVTIPLARGSNWNQVNQIVKHLRLWIQGNPGSASLTFAVISISGDRWQKKNLTVEAINNQDNPDYNPFDDSDFRSYYDEMYGDFESYNHKRKKEGALFLYGLIQREEGYVQQTFVSPKDYSSYQTLNFWIRGSDECSQQKTYSAYLRIGSDVSEEGEYLEKEVTVDFTGWRLIKTDFADMVSHGVVSLREIKQLRIELRSNFNSNPDKGVYFNDIFLSGVQKEEGLANRVGLNMELGKSLLIRSEYKTVDAAFRTIGVLPTNQQIRESSLGIDFLPLEFLPLSYGFMKSETDTLWVRDTSLSTKELGKVVEEKRDYRLDFLLPRWPKMGLTMQNKVIDYQSLAEIENEDTYRVSLEYENPYRFVLLPTSIQTVYEIEEKREIFLDAVENKKEETRKWRINLPWETFENFKFNPTYTQKTVNERSEEGFMPKLREKEFRLESQATFFHLSPRLSFQGGYMEDGFSSESPQERDISNYSQISLSLLLGMKEFFPQSQFLSTLKFYTQYEINREGLYYDTTIPLDLGSRLGLKILDLKDGRTKLILEREDFSLKQRWQPFDFLNLGTDYSNMREKKIREETSYLLKIRTWPSLDLKVDLNKSPWGIGRFSRILFATSLLMSGYVQKITHKENISSTRTYQPSLVWKGDFKKPEDLSLTVSYNSTEYRKKYHEEPAILVKFSSLSGIKLDYFTICPWGKKIPFLRRIINFDHKIHFTTGLDRQREKKYLISGRISTNTEKWTLFAEAGYKVAKNVQMKLGLEGGYFEDRVEEGEDYYFWGGGCEVEIRF